MPVEKMKVERSIVRQAIEDFRAMPWYKEIGAFLGVSCVIALIAWGGYGFFGREDQIGKVQGFRWERVIKIETYRMVHYKRTGYKRSGAYNVRTWTESYPVTHTTTDSKGNTSTSVSIETDRYYEYDRNEWCYLRKVVAWAPDHKPHWPAYALARGPLGEWNRVASKHQTYEIFVLCEAEENIKTLLTFKPKHVEWEKYAEGESVVATLNGFGWVQSLAQLEAE